MKTAKAPLIYTGLLAFAAAAIVGWKTGSPAEAEKAPASTKSISTRVSTSSVHHLLRNVRSQRTESDRMRSAIEMAHCKSFDCKSFDNFNRFFFDFEELQIVLHFY